MTLYISDLDGTLLNSDAALSAFTLEAVNALIQRGIAFTYATARSFSSATRVTQGLRLSLPVITFNGAVITDPVTGVKLSCSQIDAETLSQAALAFQSAGLTPLVYTVIDGQEKCAWLPEGATDAMKRYAAARFGSGRMRQPANVSGLYEGEVFYLSVIGPFNTISRVRDALLPISGLHALMQEDAYIPGTYWLEAYRSDVSKGAAAISLKASCGADKLICFGDSLNDIPLFRAADAGCAVANAREELKALAAYRLDANDADGVAVWLVKNAECALKTD